MQISVLPVSTPSRTGAPGIASGDASAFEEVLNGLPPDRAQAETAAPQAVALADAPPDAAGKDGSELPPETGVPIADPVGVGAVPVPVLVSKQLAQGGMARPSLPEAKALSVGPATPPPVGDVAAPPDPAGSPSAIPASQTPPSGIATGALPATATALQTSEKPVTPGVAVASDPAVATTILPQAAAAETPLPAGVVPLPGGVVTKEGAAQKDARPVALVQPSVPKAAVQATAPIEGVDAQAAPASAEPLAALPAAAPLPLSRGALAAEGDPARAVISAGVKPGVGTITPDPFGASPVSEPALLPDAATALPEPKPAGQPSVTAAIQMLTRDDRVAPTDPPPMPEAIGDEAPTPTTAPLQKVAFVAMQQLIASQGTPQPGKGAAGIPGAPLRADAIPQTKSATPKPTLAVAAPPDSTDPKIATVAPIIVDLGIDGFRPSAGLDVSPLSSQPGGASSLAPGAPLPASVTPQGLGQAIVQVLQKGEDRQIDLALRPEELGRLRFEMTTSGDKVHITLFIERPEALDLIRRHADHLLNDLRQAGFTQASLSFGDWSHREKPAGDQPATQGSAADSADAFVPAPSEKFSPVAALGRLDIRL